MPRTNPATGNTRSEKVKNPKSQSKNAPAEPTQLLHNLPQVQSLRLP